MLLLSQLPEVALQDISEYLSLVQRRRLFQTCRTLWQGRIAAEQTVRRIVVHEEDAKHLFASQHMWLSDQIGIWKNMIHCQELDLQCYAQDAFFILIKDARLQEGVRLFPRLKRLRMRESQDISDTGLEDLARSPHLPLEEIDVTFCPQTTYEGSQILRDAFPRLRVLRRQPEWLDGHFYTPFGGSDDMSDTDGEDWGSSARRTEVHTYWPDGSFHFSREEQSSGFVVQLEMWDKNLDPCFVKDKLQYNNFQPPFHWPTWTRYCYRPGVSLLKCPPQQLDNGEILHSVLVCQKVNGLKPPDCFDIFQKARELVPMGQYRYFDIDGQVMPGRSHPRADDEGDDRRALLVSRMKLVPLKPDELLPPASLVEKNMELCRDRNRFARREQLEETENALHSFLDR